MDPDTQAHLAGLISFAREGPPAGVDLGEWKSRSLAEFNAAVGALQAVSLVSPEDRNDWTNRMLLALGEEPLEPLAPGISGVRMILVGGKRRPRPPDPPPDSVFMGLVPVHEPDRALECGGRVQILGLELYSDKVFVNWRLAPEPDYEAVFADQLAAQEPDLAGLPEPQRAQLRRRLIQRLQMQQRLLTLSDDVGTEYHSRGGGSSGGDGQKRGHSGFVPGVPQQATTLTLTWDKSLQFDVVLPAIST